MKQVAENIYEISHSMGVVTSNSGGAIVEFGDISPVVAEASPIKSVKVGKDGEKEIAFWGANNQLPIERELLVMDNNIVPGLIESKHNIILGNGIMLYKEMFETDKNGKSRRIIEECKMSTKIEEELERFEADDFLEEAAKELLIQGQFFPEFTHQAGGEVVSLENIECAYIRAERRRKDEKKGRFQIKNWLISGEWTHQGSLGTVDKVKNFDRNKEFQAKYIKRYASKIFGGPYYYSPAYWGSKNWIKLSNNIPIFHLSNLGNGYTIRFHIKFPKDYFISSPKPLSQLSEKQRKKVIDDAKAEKELFMQQLDAMLSGEKNAGKTLYTSYDIQRHIGESYPGVIVEPISVNLKDEALLKLFDKSNDANISAQGILPSISGIQSSGKLSSGSDIRNAFNFYVAAKTYSVRRKIFNPLNRIGKINKWFTGEFAGCKFGARDFMIATTDKEPTGLKSKN